MDGAPHWLVRVAQGAGLPGAESLALTPELPVADAWTEVAERCKVDQDTLDATVAKSFRLGVADLSTAESTATSVLPASVARQFAVFPLREQHRFLVVATSDPTNAVAEQEIGFASGRTPKLQIAPPDLIRELIDATYAPDRAVETLLQRIDVAGEAPVELVEDQEPEPIILVKEEFGTGPIVRLTNMILQDAVERGASDIHIQPLPTGGVVRLRIDGVLRTGVKVPLSVLARVVSRIKVMSRLDIADRLRPQDGRSRISVGGHKYELRVSTVPTRQTEKVVIRILDPYQTGTLEDTGLPPREVERVRRVLKNRDGIIVVTGPTGCGKTTTMYAALREVATPGVNIMTVEDPVEYELPGLTQIQVDVRQGVTFQTALKAILRQDPDVIFVGEIRDRDTAEMAAQASLTGHLVLATIHANDAVGSVRRFLDLGLDPGTISDTLRGSLAQRLVRTVCPDCAERVEGQPNAEEAALARYFKVQPVVRAVGCEGCGQSGYRGRKPVVELIAPSSDFLRLVASEASHVDLTMRVRKDGMVTMLEAALELVWGGLTTLEEVERVVGEEDVMTSFMTAATPAAADLESAPASLPPRAPAPPQPVPPPPARRVLLEDEEPDVRHVLVVDDDQDTRQLVRAVLESHGWTVTEAQDGAEALVRLGSGEKIDLVVLDLMMPKVSGHEVLKSARASLATAGLPIVVLTAHDNRAMEVRVLQEGADDYIRKPLDPAIFLNRVQAALRRAHA